MCVFFTLSYLNIAAVLPSTGWECSRRDYQLPFVGTTTNSLWALIEHLIDQFDSPQIFPDEQQFVGKLQACIISVRRSLARIFIYSIWVFWLWIWCWSRIVRLIGSARAKASWVTHFIRLILLLLDKLESRAHGLFQAKFEPNNNRDHLTLIQTLRPSELLKRHSKRTSITNCESWEPTGVYLSGCVLNMKSSLVRRILLVVLGRAWEQSSLI